MVIHRYLDAPFSILDTPKQQFKQHIMQILIDARAERHINARKETEGVQSIDSRSTYGWDDKFDETNLNMLNVYRSSAAWTNTKLFHLGATDNQTCHFATNRLNRRLSTLLVPAQGFTAPERALIIDLPKTC